MKKTLLTLLFVVIAGAIFAQSPFSKPQINAGVGISSWGLPVYVGVDFEVYKDITAGAELSIRSKKDFGSVFGISVNGNYHLNSLLDLPSEWDFYAGANIGYLIWAYDNNFVGTKASGLGIGGQIGGRYFFNEKFGLNLEFGGGNAFSGGKIGITFRL